MLSPNAVIIYLDHDSFYLCYWRWWRRIGVHLGKSSELFSLLELIIPSLAKNTCVDIILEKIDETYIHEFFPTLSKKDEKQLIKRKLHHHFPENTYHSGVKLYRREKKSHYLFIGVDIDIFLQSLTKRILDANLCLRSIYLSEQVICLALIKYLKKNEQLAKKEESKCCLVIEILTINMVRKSFIQNDKLAFSHCTSLNILDAEQDIQKTLKYIHQIGLLENSSKPLLVLLRQNQDTEVSSYSKLCDVTIQLISVEKNIEQPYRPSFLSLCLRKYKIIGNLITNKDLKNYHELIVRHSLWCLIFLVLLFIVFSYTTFFHSYRKISTQLLEFDSKQIEWKKKLNLQQQLLPISPQSYSKIENLVSLDVRLRKAQQSPKLLLQSLSQVLALNQEFRLDRLRWITSVNPLYPDDDSNPIVVALKTNKNSKSATQYFHILYLDGVLQDYTFSLAHSAKTFDYFLQALKQQKNLYQLEVLQSPIDSADNTHHSLTPENVIRDKPFKLKLVYLFDEI